MLVPPPTPQLRPAQDPFMSLPEMHLDSWEVGITIAARFGGARPASWSTCSTDLPPEEYEELSAAQLCAPTSLVVEGQWCSDAEGHSLVNVAALGFERVGTAVKAQALGMEEAFCPCGGAQQDHPPDQVVFQESCVSPWLQSAIDSICAKVAKKDSVPMELS